MLARTAFAALAVLTGVQGIVVTQPTAVSVWTQTGDQTGRIEWSLIPATAPPPATQFFDIYIRNGVGGMYNPSLNLLLARSVDATASTFLNVVDTKKFIPGPGYQLFFTDPANPATVYCDSDPFAIGSFEINGAPPTTTSSSLVASSTAVSSASSSSSSTTDSSKSAPPTSSSCSSSAADSTTTTSGMATSVLHSFASPPSSSSTSARAGRITAAPVPGGPDQQGFNLIPNGSAPARGWASGLALALAGTVAAVVGL